MKYFGAVEKYKLVLYRGGGNLGTIIDAMGGSISAPMPDEVVANTHDSMLEIKSVTARVQGPA